jgi:hypothetical protein
MTRKIVLNEEIRRWRSECPLYSWKRAKPGRLKVLMNRLPVSKSGIFAWLHGIALPRPELMLELEKFTHITPKAWLLWWCERPRGPDGSDDRFGLHRAAHEDLPGGPLTAHAPEGPGGVGLRPTHQNLNPRRPSPSPSLNLWR